jgi:putative FmdB family regulatory protein
MAALPLRQRFETEGRTNVPVYTYACTDCGEKVEARQSFTDEPLTVCPVCGGSLRKLFNPVGVVFKGSGFYRNDSREKKDSPEKKAPAEKAPDSAGPGSDKKDSATSKSDGTSGAGSSSDAGSSKGAVSSGSSS